jgi:chloramphenicol 3-O phosphotransferase
MFHGVVILNGGSSSGKTELVTCLQRTLPEPWIADGIDALLESLPPSLRRSDGVVQIQPDGSIVVRPDFRRLERGWMLGIAATARAGVNVLVDDVFLGGGESQARWRAALDDVPRRFIAVRCAADTAAEREAARGDRVTGMARNQAEFVHRGVSYDFEVDTTRAQAAVCANAIATYLERT